MLLSASGLANQITALLFEVPLGWLASALTTNLLGKSGKVNPTGPHIGRWRGGTARKRAEGSYVLFPGTVVSWENTPKRDLPAALRMVRAGQILPRAESSLLQRARMQCLFSQHLIVPALL